MEGFVVVVEYHAAVTAQPGRFGPVRDWEEVCRVLVAVAGREDVKDAHIEAVEVGEPPKPIRPAPRPTKDQPSGMDAMEAE